MRSLLSLLAVFALAALPCLAQTPEQPQPPQIEQAVKKLQGGDLQGAIALLEPLRNQPGVHPAALSMLGVLYLQAGRPKDSFALLEPLADGDRAGPLVLQSAARAALALGQTAKAEAYLERAVAKAPVSPASRDLGILRGSQGKLAESYRLLRPWSLAHPEDEEARLSAAYGAIELDRPSEAEELLKGMAEDNPRVRLLRGRVHVIKGEPAPAVAALEPLLKASPPSMELEVRRYLAEAHIALAESAAAIGLLQGKAGNDPSLALLLSGLTINPAIPPQALADLEPFARGLLSKEPAEGEKKLAADFALSMAALWWPSPSGRTPSRRWRPPSGSIPAACRAGSSSAGPSSRPAAARTPTGRWRSSVRSRAPRSRTPSGRAKSNGARRTRTGRNLQKALDLAAAGQADEALAMIRQEIGLAPSDPRPRPAEITVLLAAKRPARKP